MASSWAKLVLVSFTVLAISNYFLSQRLGTRYVHIDGDLIDLPQLFSPTHLNDNSSGVQASNETKVRPSHASSRSELAPFSRVVIHKRLSCFGCYDDADMGPQDGDFSLPRRRNRTRTVARMEAEREINAKTATKRAKPTPPHPHIDQSQCVPAKSWQTTFRTNCNVFHEVDFALGARNSLRLNESLGGNSTSQEAWETEKIEGLGSGKWRSAWKLSSNGLGQGRKTSKEEYIVMKTLQYSDQVQFDELSYRRNQIDAAINDRLSSSLYVVGTYGFCGQSALGEMAAGTLDKFLRWLRDKAWENALKRGKAKGLDAALFSREWGKSLPKRLRLARDAARALMHLQGVDGDNITIAHTDFRPANLVVLPSGRLQVNDFNSGELVLFNTTSKGPCMFRRGRPRSPFKCPPERVDAGPLLPASDVYSLGSVVYGLLMGQMPYTDVSAEDAWDMIRKGILPNVTKSYPDHKHPAARTMLRVAKHCWARDPHKRPSAKDVAEKLESALRNTEMMLQTK